MAYYEDEILHDLNIGESYTQRQLVIFVVENENIAVVSRSCSQFADYSDSKHRVIDIIEGYEHKGDRQRTYYIPSATTKIYIVE